MIKQTKSLSLTFSSTICLPLPVSIHVTISLMYTCTPHTQLPYLGQLILHLALGRLDLLDVQLKGCCGGLELLLHVSGYLLQERLHQRP